MRVAVDDIGIGDVQGFTAFATSAEGVRAFEDGANGILHTSGLAHFHGREFRPEHRPAYEQFCDLIRRNLEEHGGFAAFQVMPRNFFSELLERFPVRISDAVLETIGHPGSATTDLMTTKAGALVWLARFTQVVVRPAEMEVLIARDQLQDDSLNTAPVVIPAGLIEPATDLLSRIGNEYARHVFPGGPRISRLRLVDANVEAVVQAADVIGNFGMNYVKSVLRAGSAASATETTKAQIFQHAFQSEAIPHAAGAVYSVTAQNTIAAAPGAGALKFTLFALEA